MKIGVKDDATAACSSKKHMNEHVALMELCKKLRILGF